MLSRGTILAFQEAGVDVDAVARKVGAAGAGDRFTPAQADAVVDLALEAIGDPAFGLTAGASVRPELFGVIGLAAMAAPSYGAALRRLERAKRLFSVDTFALVSGRDGTAVRVQLGRPEGAHARARADIELAFAVAFGRVMTRTRVTPLRVGIRGPAPPHAARYEALFGCPIRFGEEHDEVVLSALDLARPLVGSSPELLALLGPRADEMVVEAGADDVVERARAALRRLLCGDAPTLGAAAQALGMSERSLQRRLGEAGTSFAALLDEVRREEARHRLVHTALEVPEIAYLLGFATPGSLHRAFKRWEGVTPLEFRRAARAAPERARRAQG